MQPMPALTRAIRTRPGCSRPVAHGHRTAPGDRPAGHYEQVKKELEAAGYKGESGGPGRHVDPPLHAYSQLTADPLKRIGMNVDYSRWNGARWCNAEPRARRSTKAAGTSSSQSRRQRQRPAAASAITAVPQPGSPSEYAEDGRIARPVAGGGGHGGAKKIAEQTQMLMIQKRHAVGHLLARRSSQFDHR